MHMICGLSHPKYPTWSQLAALRGIATRFWLPESDCVWTISFSPSPVINSPCGYLSSLLQTNLIYNMSLIEPEPPVSDYGNLPSDYALGSVDPILGGQVSLPLHLDIPYY